MRWWGGNTWTAGEDPTGGRGVNWQQSASPVSTSASGGLDDFTRGLMEQRAGLVSSQRGEEEGLYKQLEQVKAGQESLPSAQTRLESQLGVPGLKTQLETARGQVAGVKTQLDTLESDITSRTSGSLVTDAQRRRILASEQAPLQDTLGRLMSGQEVTAVQLSEANQTVGRQLEQIAAQNQLDLQPILMRISTFSDRAAREMSGFDNNSQLQLNSYLDKLGRDRFLSDREWQQTSDLAVQERTFEMEKEKIKLQAQVSATQGGLPPMTFEQFRSTFGQGTIAPTAPSAPPASNFNRTLDDIFGATSSVGRPLANIANLVSNPFGYLTSKLLLGR